MSASARIYVRLALSAWLGVGLALAATDVRVPFILKTTDSYGAPLQQQRFYYVYRPDNLPKTSPHPMVLIMDGGPATIFHNQADRAGFVLVSCAFSGNSSGTPATGWNAEDPLIAGPEDYDYTDEVIRRVQASENTSDVFIAGLSKGGHMALAYACARPSMIRTASSVDEFMQLTSNVPTAPVPVIMFHGTSDASVPYTMVKDTLDAWRAVDGLSAATPATTFESSPRIPGAVTQATWSGGMGGTKVAFVTVVGGTHAWPVPGAQAGYDSTVGIWAFFSQFLSDTSGLPAIVSPPVDNVQIAGQPASFHVTATGDGPLSYQWLRNGQDIPDATTSWLTIPASLEDDGATYQVAVSNDAGAATSPPATLTVKPAPSTPIITAPPADQSVAAGQPVTFSVDAAGDAPLRYQWLKNGVNIAGATASSYSIPAAISPDSGATFSVAVSNAAGSITSPRATLTVTATPGAPVILANPSRARVLSGQRATFQVSAWSATPMTYQWQKGTFGGNMADIPGATDATYSVPATTLSDHLTLVRCIVSNAAGNATSASEMLFVTSAPAAPNDITSPITVAAQAGVPFEYSIVVTGGTIPLTYSADPLPDGLVFDLESGQISGTPASPGISAIVIGAANSAGQTSRILTLTVTPDPPPLSYAAWARSNFGASAIDPSIAGPDADPDADGCTNLDEFNAGSNPLDPGSVPGAPAIQ